MSRSFIVHIVLTLTVLQVLVLGPSVTGLAQQSRPQRTLSGVVLSQQNELVPGVTVIVNSASGERRAVSDREGSFSFNVPTEPLTVRFEGKNLNPVEKNIAVGESTQNLQVKSAM